MKCVGQLEDFITEKKLHCLETESHAMLLETKESSLNQGKLGKGVGSALPYSVVAKEL